MQKGSTTLNNVSRFKHHYVDLVEEDLDQYLNDWHTTVDELKRKGFTCQSGRWTNEETKILQRNIDNHKRNHNILDFLEYVQEKNKDIWIPLRKDINRPVRAVQKKVLQLLSKEDNKVINRGNFTKNEIQTLMNLQKCYGNDWIEIGRKMGRTPASVGDKYRDIQGVSDYKKTSNKATAIKDTKPSRFSEEEDEKLKQIVFEQVYTEDGDLDFSKIDWQVISSRFGTRTVGACRQRWKLGSEKIIEGPPKRKLRGTRFPKVLKYKGIVDLLIESGITEISDINWTGVFQRIGKVDNEDAFKKRFFMFLNNIKRSSREDIDFVEKLRIIKEKGFKFYRKQFYNYVTYGNASNTQTGNSE